MTCRQRVPDIVDLARGETLDPLREAAVIRHVRVCVSCAALLEEQRSVSVALRRLATEDRVSVNQEGERTRVAAFDAAWSRPRRAKTSLGLPLAASAVLAVGMTLGWVYERHARSPVPSKTVAVPLPAAATPMAPVAPVAPVEPVATVAVSEAPVAGRSPIGGRLHRGGAVRRSAPTPEATPFVVWSGASALPRFESGELIRVDIPESALSLLGLWPSGPRNGVIHADVLVGQDGLARAVRLVQ